VPAAQVAEGLELAMRSQATGVTIFAWGTLAGNWDKVERLGEAYRSSSP